MHGKRWLLRGGFTAQFKQVCHSARSAQLSQHQPSMCPVPATQPHSKACRTLSALSPALALLKQFSACSAQFRRNSAHFSASTSPVPAQVKQCSQLQHSTLKSPGQHGTDCGPGYCFAQYSAAPSPARPRPRPPCLLSKPRSARAAHREHRSKSVACMAPGHRFHILRP